MESEGYKLYLNILMQDNKAVILMKCNRKASCNKCYRYMNIRYFCMTDLIDRKEVSVEYCLTDKMITDFFTKPF